MKNVTYKNDTYQIPFELTCTVSGSVKTYTSEEFINGVLDRAGGLENLRKTYVCRDAKRLIKEGKTPDEIKQILASGEKLPKAEKPAKVKIAKIKGDPADTPKIEIPKIEKVELRPMTKEESSPETCYNPARILAGKPCEGCAMFNICQYKDTPGCKSNIRKYSRK